MVLPLPKIYASVEPAEVDAGATPPDQLVAVVMALFVLFHVKSAALELGIVTANAKKAKRPGDWMPQFEALAQKLEEKGLNLVFFIKLGWRILMNLLYTQSRFKKIFTKNEFFRRQGNQLLRATKTAEIT